METYFEYKDSGIEWIGKIPKPWEIIKLKYLVNISSGKTTDTSENNYNLYGSTGKIGKCTSNDYNGEYLLIARVGANAGFSYYINDICGITDNTLVIKNKKNINIKYLTFFLKQYDFKKLISGSGRPLITGFDVLNIDFFKIPFDEEKTIVKFLDSKTSSIDQLITKNKKLITLLEEKKTALINHVVTKGLNPDVEMKESGIEWIGKIPKHWEINKFKYITNGKAQYGANEEPEYDENKFDYRYIRITDVNERGRLKNEKVYLSKEKALKFILEDGDILFARTGATVGKSYLYTKKDGKCCFAGYMIKYIPKQNNLVPKFIFYYTLTKSYKEWIKFMTTQSTIENVSADKYNELLIPITNIKEQLEIVNYLDDKTSKIDESISKIEKEIKLLEEYKESLIYHVVTGKVDVRGVEL